MEQISAANQISLVRNVGAFLEHSSSTGATKNYKNYNAVIDLGWNAENVRILKPEEYL